MCPEKTGFPIASHLFGIFIGLDSRKITVNDEKPHDDDPLNNSSKPP